MRRSVRVISVTLGLATLLSAQSGNQPPALLSDLVDVSPDFRDFVLTSDPLAGKVSWTVRRRGEIRGRR